MRALRNNPILTISHESNMSEIAFIRTSQARPKPGSVTQSSNTENGITTDSISIQNNTNNIVLSNTKRWSTTIPKRSRTVDMGPLEPYLDIADKGDFPFWVPENSQGTYVEVDITLEFREEFGLVFNDGGTVVDGVFGTGGSIRETDYLTLGYWVNPTRNPPATSADIEEIGLYVTGGNVFSNNIQNLTGNATYSGPVMAVIVPHNVPLPSSIDGGRGTLFGNINLTANFEDVDSLGTISGYMNDFRHYEEIDLGNGFRRGTGEVLNYPGSLILEQVNIGNNHGGFFDGNVSGNLNGRDYQGKWGGQFYGAYLPKCQGTETSCQDLLLSVISWISIWS